MIMLNDIQLKNIKSVEEIVFATADENGMPRAIIVQPSRIEKDRIIICNIQMNKSFENLKNNNKCFVNVFVPENDNLQYKIEGTAEILSSGELFDEIKNFEENENGLLEYGLTVNDVIVIKIEHLEESNG